MMALEDAEILDACCGGRMWWWDKAHPLAVYLDRRREGKDGRYGVNTNWTCQPDVLGDFRAMPFEDGSFRLVVFDPPHLVSGQPSGNVTRLYGALHPDTEQDDIRRGFEECWRVLKPGGTLVFKWAGPIDRVRPHFPATPIVGTRRVARNNGTGSGIGTRWIIFYKPEASA